MRGSTVAARCDGDSEAEGYLANELVASHKSAAHTVQLYSSQTSNLGWWCHIRLLNLNSHDMTHDHATVTRL